MFASSPVALGWHVTNIIRFLQAQMLDFQPHFSQHEQAKRVETAPQTGESGAQRLSPEFSHWLF